jgi:hypothetical protein
MAKATSAMLQAPQCLAALGSFVSLSALHKAFARLAASVDDGVS